MNTDLISNKEININNSNEVNDYKIITELLLNSQLTLPKLLINICKDNDFKPLTINEFYEQAQNNLNKIRRTDGSKYCNSINTIRSTICSINLFKEIKEEKYILDTKQAIKYLNSIKEKNIKIKKYQINDNKEKEIISDDNKYIKYKKKIYLFEELYNKINYENKGKLKINFNKYENIDDIKNELKSEVIEGIIIFFDSFREIIKSSLYNFNEKDKDDKENFMEINSSLIQLKDKINDIQQIIKSKIDI